MKERPILFSTPMVQAILADKKTMTRRVVAPNCLPGAPMSGFEAYQTDDGPNQGKFGFSSEDADWVCPYGRPGDLLWVRETWSTDDTDKIVFKADDPEREMFPIGWKPSIHMKKLHCRLWLKVKSVRVERLHEITHDDAIAEGMETKFSDTVKTPPPAEQFQILWDKLNGKPRPNGVDISWAANPWVWVVEFERTDRAQATKEAS